MTRKLSQALVTIASVTFYTVIMPLAMLAFLCMSAFYLIKEYFHLGKG